jgi:hypothetical protein
MTKTPGEVQPPKQITKAERDARKAGSWSIAPTTGARIPL